MQRRTAASANQVPCASAGWPRQLLLPVAELRRTRLNEGSRQSMRSFVTARESMSKDRPRSFNALNVLVRSNDLDIDARRKLTRSSSRRSPGGAQAK